MAKTLSGNIDSPVAGALVGPVVHVSGTVSVVGSGPPFVHQVDQVTVQVGTGSQVTAQVTGPANLNTFPRSRRSVRLGRPAIYFGRPGPAGRSPAEEARAASKHLHLADVRMSQSCRWSARTAEGTGWNAEQGLVRCAEAGQDSLGTNDRSTRLRSQR